MANRKKTSRKITPKKKPPVKEKLPEKKVAPEEVSNEPIKDLPKEVSKPVAKKEDSKKEDEDAAKKAEIKAAEAKAKEKAKEEAENAKESADKETENTEPSKDDDCPCDCSGDESESADDNETLAKKLRDALDDSIAPEILLQYEACMHPSVQQTKETLRQNQLLLLRFIKGVLRPTEESAAKLTILLTRMRAMPEIYSELIITRQIPEMISRRQADEWVLRFIWLLCRIQEPERLRDTQKEIDLAGLLRGMPVNGFDFIVQYLSSYE